MGWRDPGRESQCSGWRTVLTNLMVSSSLALGFTEVLQANSNCLEVVTVSQLIMSMTLPTEMNTQHMQA